MANQVIPYSTVTAVFEWNWKCRAEVVINQGGTSSSKTFSILQVLFLRSILEPNIITTVVGGDIPDLKSGALRDAKMIVATSDYVRGHIVQFNSTDRVYYFRNGSVMEFKSYQDEFDARSGKRRYLYINEAQNVSKEVFDELNDRTFGQAFLDYNPTVRFWAHDLIGTSGVQLFISNFLHNSWCDPKVRRNLLRYRTTNPARWRVYGLGLTGEVEGAIFQKVFNADTFPDVSFVYGLDFGYSNDPTALVKAAQNGPALYGQQILYERGLSDARLAAKMRAAGVSYYDKIVADPADPKAIDALRDEGFWVEPAEKGPDSIAFGIERINSFEGGVYLCGESPDWWTERENYVWQKKNGKYTNRPIDGWNHCWDGFRYAVTDLTTNGNGILASG
jgi:phage terminase large subunit